MFTSLFKFLIIALFMMSTTSVAYATTLQSVIDKFCRTNCITAEQLVDVASRAASRYNLDMRAIIAVIHVESKYHIKAKNGSSMGLSQVLLRYHRSKFIGTDYYDIDDNVFAGMQVLRDCLKRRKGNYPAAFACYNGGGDPNYRKKANKAYAMVKGLSLPSIDKDPLGTFITAQLQGSNMKIGSIVANAQATPDKLYHGSGYEQNELKPGFSHSKKLTVWDEYENNAYLYATVDRDSAITLGISSAWEKKFKLLSTSISVDRKTIDLGFEGKVPDRSDLDNVDVFVYTLNLDHSAWRKNNNPNNNIKTEYKTTETIRDILDRERVDVTQVLKGYHITMRSVA